MARPARNPADPRGAVGASGLSTDRLSAIRRAVDASCRSIPRRRFVVPVRGIVGPSWPGASPIHFRGRYSFRFVRSMSPRPSWNAFISGDCSYRAMSGMSPAFVWALVVLAPLVVRLWSLVLGG